MPIAFDRSVCCDLNETISREWLITNGLGGYAAGTVAGVLTRMQHGLLVAPPRDGASPHLLLAKVDEEIVFDQRTYYLGTNEYSTGTLNPAGFVHLEAFHLEEGFPVFTYRLGGIDGILLEKRIWMPYGYNTTYIQYRVLGRTETDSSPYSWNTSNGRLEASNKSFGYYHGYPEAAQWDAINLVPTLTLLPFSAYRPPAQPQYGNNDWHFQVEVHNGDQDALEDEQREQVSSRGIAGCTVRAYDGAAPYSVFVIGHPDSQATFIPTGVWYWHFLRRHDQTAGRPAEDDFYLPGVIRAKLWPGEDSSLTIMATTEELHLQILSSKGIHGENPYDLSYKRNVESQRSVLQTQRYFGEGGEVGHRLHVLPLPTLRDAINLVPTPSTPGDGINLVSTLPELTSMDEQEESSVARGEEFLRLLLQAADRFLIRRMVPPSEQAAIQPFFTESEHIPVILSDYYSGEDRTRDTLIALPGLTLASRRYDFARQILRNLARSFKQGMLPDRLELPAPQTGFPQETSLHGQSVEESNYGSVDITLWYFYALDHYLRMTGDYELLDELYQRLVDSIDWYMRGTYHGIQADSNDGLLRAQQPGKALTWMNASINGLPVTPREGKPVEVNALWYHALSLMHEWSQVQQQRGRTSYRPAYYAEQSMLCKQSFNLRFWHEFGSYLYDGVDGPGGDDARFRPNQLLALSLRYPVLNTEHWQAVFESVTQHLVTPCGLRTLAPQEAEYQGQLKKNEEEQLRALHQGSAWPWLIGPYIDAMLNISDAFSTIKQVEEKDQPQANWWQRSLAMLEPLRKQLHQGVLGMVGGVYDGDIPQHAGYNAASALSVGEILRVYNLLAEKYIRQPLNLVARRATPGE